MDPDLEKVIRIKNMTVIVDQVLDAWACDLSAEKKREWFDTLCWCPEVQDSIHLFNDGMVSADVVSRELDKALAEARRSLGLLYEKYLGINPEI